MFSKTSKTVLLLIAACIGCCAVPLVALVSGLSGLGVAAMVSNKALDIFICLITIAIMAVVWLYSRQRKKNCCNQPQADCSASYCKHNHQ